MHNGVRRNWTVSFIVQAMGPTSSVPKLSDYERYLGFNYHSDEAYSWVVHEFMRDDVHQKDYYQYSSEGMIYWVDSRTSESTWKHPLYDKYKTMLMV